MIEHPNMSEAQSGKDDEQEGVKQKRKLTRPEEMLYLIVLVLWGAAFGIELANDSKFPGSSLIGPLLGGLLGTLLFLIGALISKASSKTTLITGQILVYGGAWLMGIALGDCLVKDFKLTGSYSFSILGTIIMVATIYVFRKSSQER